MSDEHLTREGIHIVEQPDDADLPADPGVAVTKRALDALKPLLDQVVKFEQDGFLATTSRRVITVAEGVEYSGHTEFVGLTLSVVQARELLAAFRESQMIEENIHQEQS